MTNGKQPSPPKTKEAPKVCVKIITPLIFSPLRSVATPELNVSCHYLGICTFSSDFTLTLSLLAICLLSGLTFLLFSSSLNYLLM